MNPGRPEPEWKGWRYSELAKPVRQSKPKTRVSPSPSDTVGGIRSGNPSPTASTGNIPDVDGARKLDRGPSQDGTESPGGNIDMNVDDPVMSDSVPDVEDLSAGGRAGETLASDTAVQHNGNDTVRGGRNRPTHYRCAYVYVCVINP